METGAPPPTWPFEWRLQSHLPFLERTIQMETGAPPPTGPREWRREPLPTGDWTNPLTSDPDGNWSLPLTLETGAPTYWRRNGHPVRMKTGAPLHLLGDWNPPTTYWRLDERPIQMETGDWMNIRSRWRLETG